MPRQHHRPAPHHHRVHRHHLVHRRHPAAQPIWIFGGIIALLLGVDAFVIWSNFAPSSSSTPTPTETPTSSPLAATTPTPTPTPTPTTVPLPADVNIPIPFTPQAPTANWDKEHEEFCEEASMLMVERFFAGKPIASPADAEAGLQEINSWEQSHGFTTPDLTAAQVAQILQERDGFTTQLITNPTVDDLKQAVAQNHPVIVPAAGQRLGNPYFTPPGPVYHMLIMKGYTSAGKLITNDPGVKQGANYQYDPTIFMNAIGDWNNGHPETGAKVVLVIEKS